MAVGFDLIFILVIKFLHMSQQLNCHDIHVQYWALIIHYDDVTMSLMASQITSLTIVYSTFYSGADQRKLQSSASLAFVRGIHRGPVNSPHKRPVTRKMFPFDDVIMKRNVHSSVSMSWRQLDISTRYDQYLWRKDTLHHPVLGSLAPRKWTYFRHMMFPYSFSSTFLQV